MKQTSLREFEGVQVPHDLQRPNPYLDAVNSAVELAAVVHRQARIDDKATARLAVHASLHSANALIALAQATCSLAQPPEPIEIHTNPNPPHDLIYRCLHKDPHEWNLRGKLL